MTRTDTHLAAWRIYREGRDGAAFASTLKVSPLAAESILLDTGISEMEFGRMAAAAVLYDHVETILENR